MIVIKKSFFIDAIYSLGYVLFFLMLFLSSTAQDLKKILLLVIFIPVLMRLMLKHGKMNINYDLLFLYLMLVLLGLFSQTLGWINDTPGYTQTYTVFIIYPLMYIFLVEVIEDTNKIINLYKVIIISGFAISLYILSFVLTKIGFLSDFFFIPLDLDERLGLHAGYIELNMNSLTSIIYIFPFLLSLFFSKDNWNIFTKNWKIFMMVSFILVLLISIISGRRSLWLIMVLSVLIHFLLLNIYQRKSLFRFEITKKKIVIAIAFGLLISIGFYYLDLSLVTIFENIIAGFDSSQDESANIKSEQFYYLMEGFYNSPLIGYGLGASPAMMMDRIEPWAFELSYIALLYHTGIVGILVYAFFIGWIFYRGIFIVSTGTIYGQIMLPVLVSTVCFLIANTVNPYLMKFDFIWIVLFLPGVIINLYDRHK